MSGIYKNGRHTKFIRNRDIKLKGSEIKREQHIQKAMCEGVCTRCREKAQWRFRFDKYKPLKAPASCQGCKQKTVTKAYRHLCEKCANSRKVCAGCGGELTLEENDGEGAGPAEGAPSSSALVKGKAKATTNEEEEEEEEEEDMEDDEEDVDDEDEDFDEDEEEEEEEADAKALSTAQSDWDEQHFLAIAAKKYSKNRVVGSASDTAFSGVAPTDG